MKKSKVKQRRINKKFLAVVVAGALLISAQAFINFALWKKWNTDDPNVIRSLVIAANDNLYKYAVVEARSGDLYIPEARLRIPRANGQSSLHYAYYPASDQEKRDEEIYVSATGWMTGRVKLYTGSEVGEKDDLSTFLKQVPFYQACTRQFMIKFNKTNSSISTSYSYTQSVTLGDGRVAYLYENGDCQTKDNSFALLYFAGLQSY